MKSYKEKLAAELQIKPQRGKSVFRFQDYIVQKHYSSTWNKWEEMIKSSDTEKQEAEQQHWISYRGSFTVRKAMYINSVKKVEEIAEDASHKLMSWSHMKVWSKQ